MPDDAKKIELLNAQMNAVGDTKTNLVGLIEKATGIQLELMEGGLDSFADRLGKVFSPVSKVVEDLQEVHDDMEMERNRLQNE
jgi:hypothetical protein